MLRLAPLTLCLALAACGGSSSGSRGQLGTLDPLPVPFTDEFAPLAARLAVTQSQIVAASYRNTLDNIDTIRTECAAFLTHTTSNGNTRLEVRNCAVSNHVGGSYYGRNTNILMSYQEDDLTGELTVDIERFEDDVVLMSGGLQQQTRVITDGRFGVALGGGEVHLSDANTRFTRHVVTQAPGSTDVDLTYFRLQDYHLDASPETDPARYSQEGRMIVSVDGVLGYVDIVTDTPLEIRADELCPFAGEVQVFGRDNDEMRITFNEDDISVVINGNTELYNCEDFRAWLDPV